jgi:hypothetical protein
MAKKATNPQNIKGKGFDKHPENINKAGRPKKLPDLDEIISKVLNEKCINKLTRAENIFRKMAIKAETDVRAYEAIFDRSYGKVKISAGIEIDIKKMSDEQLDQILSRLIKMSDDKET